MKKEELQKVLRPIIKECVKEVMMETLISEGYLSKIVTEVAKGMQPMLVEQQTAPRRNKNESVNDFDSENFNEIKKKSQASRMKIAEARKRLSEAAGLDAYNGIDIFEGTTPLTAHQAGAVKSSPSDSLGDPEDPGVDISSLIPAAIKVNKMLNKKGL